MHPGRVLPDLACDRPCGILFTLAQGNLRNFALDLPSCGTEGAAYLGRSGDGIDDKGDCEIHLGSGAAVRCTFGILFDGIHANERDRRFNDRHEDMPRESRPSSPRL